VLSSSKRTSLHIAASIICLFVLLGTLYAARTPLWQVPDEPAHFNYVRHVALFRQLPTLRPGDYPADYLEEIKAAHFPPDKSVETIRYESWQPPLYYVLAGGVYLITSGLGLHAQVVALRLLSVLLSAGTLWIIYRQASDLFPQDRLVPLASLAFAATLPMFIAISAGVGNDALAILLASAILWLAVRIVVGGWTRERGAAAGVLVGLALLTKSTIYPIAGLLAVAVCLGHGTAGRAAPRPTRQHLQRLGAVLAIALLIGAPWFVRNAAVYGNWDVMAWQRHGEVVEGQLRTSELVSQVGLRGLLQRFVTTSFRSFWGQFGWMGVLLDQRVYTALAVWSVMLVAGLAIAARRAWPERHDPLAAPARSQALGMLSLYALLTGALYVIYNATFVQHQGRYLFPALAPIAIAASVAFRELTHPGTARLVALSLAGLAAVALALGWLRSDIPYWTMGIVALACAVMSLVARLPRPAGWLWPGAVYLAFLCLDWASLYTFILPAL